MGEREDAEREFERVFGKTQKSSDQDASNSPSLYAPTQKLPGDSDVLGIRTDSDRFIFKNPIPERLPIEPAAAPKTDLPNPNKGTDGPAQDAMTIALNVNVFANIPKPGEETKPGDLSNAAWSEATQLFVRKLADPSPPSDGPTFAISLPKDLPKPGTDKVPAHDTAQPLPTAKFTRVLHMQDSVTLPQPPAQIPPQTTLASLSSDSASAASSTAAAPSDFTRIVKGSELRALQEKLAAASGGAAATDPSTWPVAPSAAPSLPAGMATQIWSASAAQTQRQATQHLQPWAQPSTPLPPMPKPPEPPVAQPSKLSQYMPLILVMNLLFLLAILLIVFFAVKK